MSAPQFVRPLLVLDLDETLWHGVDDPASPTGDRFLLRPHLREFLETVSQHYDLAAWTAATEDWMLDGLAAIYEATKFDLAHRAFFLWHRTRCTWRRGQDGGYECRKPARKFDAKWIRSKYPRSRVLVVDDTASNWACGYGHLVKVSAWEGDESDDELEVLRHYLASLVEHEDFRRIEKRGWRTRNLELLG